MKNKFDVLRILSVGALALGGIASLMSNYVTKRETEAYIDEKINDALADKNEKEEESE